MALYPYAMQMNNGIVNAQNAVQNNGINWVQGVEGAKAFSMAPNSNAILMDSETNGRMYIKVCDNIGMCTLRHFNYKETTPEKIQDVDTSQFVTRSELTSIISDLREGIKHEQSVSATDTKSSSTKR